MFSQLNYWPTIADLQRFRRSAPGRRIRKAARLGLYPKETNHAKMAGRNGQDLNPHLAVLETAVFPLNYVPM